MRSRNLWPRTAVTPDQNVVAENPGAASDRAAVAPALPDNRCGLAGDRCFVDPRDAIDHVTISRDNFAGFADNHVAGSQVAGGDLFLGV